MNDFKEVYAKLNDAQRQAVDTIEGPLLVVAGPGTGKTQLLSARVANILKKTDMLPQNILCLTFTDNAATNMRERLASMLGPDAYKVAIHTFHSFGGEVINRHGEYFYKGAHFRPADDLAIYETVTKILEKLPHKNPLASSMNGQYTYLRDVITSISELKRAGLTPDELDTIIEKNDAFLEWIDPKIRDVFAAGINKKSLPAIRGLSEQIQAYKEEPLELIGYTPLFEVIGNSLELALEASAVAGDSTKPVTAWKKTYLEKDARNDQVLKDAKRCKKLHALSKVYDSYLVAMQENELYDFDDMILRVVHAMELFDELRYNLQETYQYILVDEFQDTNDAQMRLIWNLTNNPVSEGRPNIMVVGDDDQAIYRFQGADLSNILDFENRYRDVKVVTLRDNYRSGNQILELARSVIGQGTERLENLHPEIDKQLTPHHTPREQLVTLREYETTSEELYGLAETIQNDIAKAPGQTRAVIARNHKQLVSLLPHLTARGISVSYERQDDVLETEPVKQLDLIARVVHGIASGADRDIDPYISELLAHPAWGIDSVELWRLSLDASRSRTNWIETMLERDGRLRAIATWLVEAAKTSKTEPLESMLDTLFDTPDGSIANETTSETEVPFVEEKPADFISPLYNYFFGVDAFDTRASEYLAHLAALQKIRAKLREYRVDATLKLGDFVDFITLHWELGMPIRANSDVETGTQCVTLLSAHKAKGLEYDTVYILNAQENIWGSSAKHHSRSLSFSSNLPISPAGDSDDERLRLLFVALTRARNKLILTTSRYDDNGKQLLQVGSLDASTLPIETQKQFSPSKAIETARIDWRGSLLGVQNTDRKALLAPLLEQYMLSVTHLNNFIDVSSAGPDLFLLHNLLHFPEAMSPSAAFGSAMHRTLQRVHQHLNATKLRMPVEDVLNLYETIIGEYALSDLDREKYLERGTQVLTRFLDQRYDSFNPEQRVEQAFGHENVFVGTAHLTGALDLIDIDEKQKTIVVTDYKTGKAASRWQGKDDYEKIKLHKYEQQLMFYKLLVENSRRYKGYTVTSGRIEFLEPNERDEIVLLDYTYDPEKLERFRKIMCAVWDRIMELDFAMPAVYEANIKGILSFEEDLIS